MRRLYAWIHRLCPGIGAVRFDPDGSGTRVTWRCSSCGFTEPFVTTVPPERARAEFRDFRTP